MWSHGYDCNTHCSLPSACCRLSPASLCSGPTCCPALHPLRPPPPHTHTHTPTPTPHRQRYLDLIVSDEVRTTFRARSKIISALRRHLEDAGFLEVSVRGCVRCVLAYWR